MATLTYTRTTVARNPQDTASPGAPAAQTPVAFDPKGAAIVVQLSSSRGVEIFPLTVGEAVNIVVS
jgi:hypothetical protein